MVSVITAWAVTWTPLREITDEEREFIVEAFEPVDGTCNQFLIDAGQLEQIEQEHKDEGTWQAHKTVFNMLRAAIEKHGEGRGEFTLAVDP